MASIRQRSKNSWQITVSNGYDSNGRKLIKQKSIKLDPALTPRQVEKEIDRLALEFEMQVEKGTYLDGAKMTFADFVDRWLIDYAEKELELKTVFRYKEMLDSRIIPALGHIKLEKLQPTHLLEFYNNLAEAGIRLDTKYIASSDFKNIMDSQGMNRIKLVKASGISDKTIGNALKGLPIARKSAENISKTLDVKLSLIFTQYGEPGKLSSRTILHHHRLISSILTSAVQWQILFSNPAERVKAPKTEKKTVQCYDEKQTKELLKALGSEPLNYKAMVLLDVFSGLRLGELMGLDWSDVDFKSNTISITKASQHLAGMGTFEKNPKNETSVRKITVPALVIAFLKEYRKWWLEQKVACCDLWQKSDRLFVTWDGQPLFTYTLTNWFPAFLKRHNLPHITPHGLRHTSATLLAAQGLEVAAISKRLGHARTSTTMDIYVHALRSADTAASDLLEKALLNNQTEIV